MNDVQLREVLHRATAPLEAPDLARTTLEGVTQARRRRRGGAVLLAAAVVVGVVGIGALGQDPQPSDPTPMSPTPGPSEPQDELERLYALPTPPPIDESVVQPVWDPRSVGTLPQADVGLPARLDELRFDLPELPETQAVVALLDGDDGLQVVTPDGARYRLDAPDEPLINTGSVSELSHDGTAVVYAGRDALWSWDVRVGGWRRTEYPTGVRSLDGWEMHLLTQSGTTVFLGRHDRAWRVDLSSGSAVPLGETLEGLVLAGELAVRMRFNHGVRTLSVGTFGEQGRQWRVDSLGHLAGSATDGLSLAATRENVTYTLPRRGTGRDGLVALDLDDLSARAYLPFADGIGDHYPAVGGTRVLAWLDADTVLLTVVPPGASTRWLVTWQVETGELRKVTQLQTGTDVSVAPLLFRP